MKVQLKKILSDDYTIFETEILFHNVYLISK